MDLIPTLRPNSSLLIEHGRRYPSRSGIFERRLSAPHESVLDSIDSPCAESALASMPHGRFSGPITCASVPPLQQIPGKVEFSSVDDPHDKTSQVQRVSRLSHEMIGSATMMLRVQRALCLNKKAGRCGRGLAFGSKPSSYVGNAYARLLEIYG